MSEIIQHITIEGQRWDTVAQINYGSAEMMGAIMEANPSVPKYDRLPAGIVLDIPIIDSSDIAISNESLPPWKRE